MSTLLKLKTSAKSVQTSAEVSRKYYVLTNLSARTYEDEYDVLTKVFTCTYEDEYDVLTKVFTRTY